LPAPEQADDKVISRKRYDNGYPPIVEWANVRTGFPAVSACVHRTALPTCLAADYRRG
jgi:hypothetical protein